MAHINFVMQSIRTTLRRKPAPQGSTPRVLARRRCRTAAAWLAYFRRNAARCRPIPWEMGAQVTAEELTAVVCSLQAWQLGETSDGRHLLAAAARYATRIGDPAYHTAVELFVREEQRHGDLLGRFLDLAGPGRHRHRLGRYLVPRRPLFHHRHGSVDHARGHGRDAGHDLLQRHSLCHGVARASGDLCRSWPTKGRTSSFSVSGWPSCFALGRGLAFG